MRIGSWLICSLASLALCAGCGGREEYPVTGRVQYDGQPVEQGTISFVPEEAGAHPDAGPIVNGAYEVLVTPGKKRVEITASRPLPPERQTTPDMGLIYEDYLPATYNRQSTLTAEVTPAARKFDFDLEAE